MFRGNHRHQGAHYMCLLKLQLLKIYIKTATTCFGVITIIRKRTI